MKLGIQLLALVIAATVVACSTGNPHVENCKIGCEARTRKGSDMVDACKRMCEKYDK